MRRLRILGIDPGSRLTGYGCIDVIDRKLIHLEDGTLTLSGTSGKQDVPLEERLLLIYDGLSKVIERLKPDVMVIERVFFAKNAVSALKLGQARGAAILTGKMHGLEIVEYSPSEVKRAVVGHGQADKDQVARMVKTQIGEREFETSDASDGLALAICHAYCSASEWAMARAVARDSAPGSDKGRHGAQSDESSSAILRQAFGQRKKKRKSLAESIGIGRVGGVHKEGNKAK
jgi:crossover junction endodeoxyribonuclease RuvC